jgi:hypothetical protein
MKGLSFQQEFPLLLYLEILSITKSRTDRVKKSAVQLEFNIWKTFLILLQFIILLRFASLLGCLKK